MSERLAIDEDLVRRLPLPLAQLYRRAHNAKTPLERHQSAYYLWEATLKLLGSVAIVQYAELGDRDAELAERLKNLSRPSVGHWWEFVRRLVPVLANSGDTRFAVIRDLLLGRARDDLPRAAGLDAALVELLEAHGGARNTVRLAELFDRLVRYRNSELGHGAAGQRPDEFYDRMGRALLLGIAEIQGRLDALAGRQLVYVADVRRQASGDWLVERYELVGETARRLESLEVPEAEVDRLPVPGRACLWASEPLWAEARNPFCSLHPLVLYEPDTDEVFFLSARRGRQRAEYLCYSTGRVLDREELGTDQRELLGRVLGAPVQAEAAEVWAARSSGEEPAEPTGEHASARRAIGEFELLSRIGRGGMGVVYRAWQPSLGRQVALKCLLRSGDSKAESRFGREIRALGRVEHPHLVKIFTSGSEGDQWFYAMELVEGADLSSVCEHLSGSTASEVDENQWRHALTTASEEARKKEETLSDDQQPASVPPAAAHPPPPAQQAEPKARTVARGGQGHIVQVVEIVRQVAEATHALHEASVIHRDIKPGNIMLTSDGSHAVLMDLGLAQLADETDGRLTRTRQFVGTLRYASPEQVLSVPLDRRSDVYSLGATLWELLTLRPLFGATDQTPTPELMLKIQSADPDRTRRLNPRVSSDLESIVRKCLEKDRSRRYATASDLAADLARWQQGEPVTAQPPSLHYVLGKYARRYRIRIATCVAVLVASLLGTVTAFYRVDRALRDAETARDDARAQHGVAVGAQKEAEEHRDAAVAGLYRSLISETRALRLARDRAGWRYDALANLQRAARLETPDRNLAELRGEAVACIAGFDVREVAHFDGKNQNIWSLDFSPDGTLLASHDYLGRVLIWDVNEARLVSEITDTDVVAVERYLARSPFPAVRFRPDGSYLAYSTWGQAVAFLRLAGPDKPLARLAAKSYPRSLAFDRTGAMLAVGWGDGQVGLYDASELTPKRPAIQARKRMAGLLVPIALSPDGTLLAAVGPEDNKSVQLVSLSEEKQPDVLGRHEQEVRALCFSADGRFLASAASDNTLILWDVPGRKESRTLRGHTASVTGVAFNPDARLVASSSDDGSLRLWDTSTGDAMMVLRPNIGRLLSVSFSPDGTHLAAACDTVVLYEVTTGKERQELAGHTGSVPGLAFHPQRQILASGSWDAKVIVWDLPSGHDIGQWHAHPFARARSLAFSPDGALLAVGSQSDATNKPKDRVICLWELDTGKLRRALAGVGEDVESLAFDPSGKLLASGSMNGITSLWDVSTGVELSRWQGDRRDIQDIAFVNKGSALLSGARGGEIVVGQVPGGEVIGVGAVPGGLNRIAIAPDERQAAVACGDGAIRIFNLPELQLVATLERAHDESVVGITFSFDGSLLASADSRQVVLWNSQTLERLVVLPPRNGKIWRVAFEPNGMHLAISGEDTTVTVWDLSMVRLQLARIELDWEGPAPATSTLVGVLAPPTPRPPKLVQAGLTRTPEASDSYNRVETLFRSGRWEELPEAAAEAVKANPEDKNVYRFLGEAHYHLGHYAEAAAAAQRHLDLCPDCLWALDQLASCRMALESYEEAAEACERILKLRPATASAMRTRAEAILHLGRYAEAQRDLIFYAQTTQTDKAWAYGKLALTNRLLGEEDAATANAERALAYHFNLPSLDGINPESITGTMVEALRHIYHGRHREGLATVEEAAKLHGDEPEFLFALARVYAVAIRHIPADMAKEERHSLEQQWRSRTIELISRAIEHGFTDREALRANQDFEAVRQDPRFPKDPASTPGR